METPGGAVNDVRTCPSNSNLVACASKDSTVRIFHIRNNACLVVMGGLNTHNDQVLSVDWAATGDYVLSCGFDHQIMKWDLSVDHVKKHLDAACKALEFGQRDILNQMTPLDYGGPVVPPKKLPKVSSVKLENYEPNIEDQEVIDQIIGIIAKPPLVFSFPTKFPNLFFQWLLAYNLRANCCLQRSTCGLRWLCPDSWYQWLHLYQGVRKGKFDQLMAFWRTKRHCREETSNWTSHICDKTCNCTAQIWKPMVRQIRHRSKKIMARLRISWRIREFFQYENSKSPTVSNRADCFPHSLLPEFSAFLSQEISFVKWRSRQMVVSW